MLMRNLRHGMLATVIPLLLAAVPAHAQAPIFSEAHTLAAATTGVPIEHTFSVTSAGNYTITLTDLGASQPPPLPPAPLASVKLAVSSDNALVGAPLIGAGTLQLNSLAAGNYTLHVVGMPGNVPGSGPIGIVINGPGNTELVSYQDVIALPSNGLPNGEAVLDQSFTVLTTGSYTVTLADLQLPQALAPDTLSLIVIEQGTRVLELPDATSPTPMQWTGTLNAGTNYQVFAIALAAAPANAGLFSVVIAASGGGVVKGWTVPVGNTMLVGSPTLKGGPNPESFVLSDLGYPAALQQVQAMLTLNGTVVASLAAAGSAPFTPATATYEAYAAGIAASGGAGAGSYAVQVTQGATVLFGAAEAVSTSGNALTPYSFNTTLQNGGAYTLSLTDFLFPAPFTSVEVAAVQGGTLLGAPLTGPGTLNIKGVAGPLTLLAFAQPASGGGLFGLDIAPQGGGAAVFDVTQGAGALFLSRKASVLAAGNYSVTATDLQFPAQFQNYDTIVTQGSKQLGAIFGGGSFVFNATAAGNYYLNFLAEPGGTDAAGTYALTLAQAPPSPVVTLSADHSQVSSGSTVDLIWSSQNATSCTASGGWSGTQKTSGTYTTPALSANTTFTLTCTGAGGSTMKSVSVSVTSSSGGGGGAMDPVLLLLTALLAFGRAAHAAHITPSLRARRVCALFRPGQEDTDRNL
ncbi:MAG TPA: hypothetical protein VMT66_03545 [Steroidobacteraceae bacterium]|nr:hypothetical protein [Steroidobacteraceae bacterium]